MYQALGKNMHLSKRGPFVDLIYIKFSRFNGFIKNNLFFPCNFLSYKKAKGHLNTERI
jgi:hypothetical protein